MVGRALKERVMKGSSRAEPMEQTASTHEGFPEATYSAPPFLQNKIAKEEEERKAVDYPGDLTEAARHGI